MYDFLLFVKKHRVISGVILALVCVGLVICLYLLSKSPQKLASESGEETDEVTISSYFENTDYPVTVESTDRALDISLDGSASADLKWEYTVNDDSITYIEENSGESEGKLDITVKPRSIGYAKYTFKRSGAAYDAAIIYVNTVVWENNDGTLNIRLSDISQGRTSGMVGASDTEYPYIVSGNTVILQNHGDWELTADVPEGIPESVYSIIKFTDDEGRTGFSVTMDVSEAATNDIVDERVYSSRLLLKSKKLGMEQRFTLEVDEDMEWLLIPVEASDED